MSNEAAEASFCEMRMLLDKYVEGSSTYDVESGLKRNFVLFGSIDDLDYGFMGDGPGRPGNTFHDKKVRIDIRTPVDEEFLGRVRETRGQSLDVDDAPTFNVGDFCNLNPCGLAFVHQDLSTEPFEADGEKYEPEPIEIYLSLPLDAFEVMRRQAAEAYETRRILSARMRLVGNALPPKGQRLPVFGLKLNELDISKKNEYAIQSFEISPTRFVDSDRCRVEYLRPEKGEDYGIGLSIRLSSVRYELAIERPVDLWPMDMSISCLGRITNAHGKPYQGVEVEVNFLEHETNCFGEMPKKAYFGTFEYSPRDFVPEGFPKDFFPEGLNASLSFDLRYAQADARNLINELVGPGPNAEVVLSVLLAVEHAAFDGTSKVAGNVRRYGFNVSQPLVATDLENAATKADFEQLGKAVGELHDLTESIRTEDESTYFPDRPATKSDLKLLHDSIAESNVAPVVAQLIENLQHISSRITRIWWFLFGGLVAGIAVHLAYASPWQ